MSKFTWGEETWDNVDEPRTVFMRMEEGQNVVRVASTPWKYWIHWTMDAAGNRKKIKCAGEQGCPVCEKVDREMADLRASSNDKKHKEARKQRYLFAIIDRKDGQAKLLDAGPQIVQGIRKMADKPQLGKPSGYDIDITVNPQSTNQYYSVTSIPNGPDGITKYPITDQEKNSLREFMENVDIQALITPDTAENIRNVLGLVTTDESKSKDEPKQESFTPEAEGVDEDEDFMNFD